MNLHLPALPAARSPATAVATIVVLESPNHSLAIDPNAIGRVVQGILTGIGFLGR